MKINSSVKKPISRYALAVSDAIVPFIYSPRIRERFSRAKLLISCGDLPYYYLEYIVSMLDIPFFFVRGNHDQAIGYISDQKKVEPRGGINLHRKVVSSGGLLLAGIEGCLRYRDGPFQYSQTEMWEHVFSLVPGVILNRVRYGRFLDVLVTHAPPHGIHDQPDLPHQGIRAFRWFIATFKPAYHFHGHVHVYRPDATTETNFDKTRVVNTFGYGETLIQINQPT